ncbi:type VI secretion system-associated FHA domain protein TagH [Pseudomonas sp. IPO3749]|uniref:type VI secretion system-associated FHA domain protein TagH n=1 Tax=Pseudomonas sp. IPO3749 TaxID=2738833 RepID=UPI0015A04C5E|nr:type VI secretion system-associated FHA domain protein TagH [Pseudomonas sp. IPO3749]NWD99754.1 type VI secretion system-associated FHA domain protein TagH [Pseudomonas sp. IPO3749]NWF21461.1 type VI secretion system-associated FHA domain protein TagH [Pseudomonas sp. IPO3749]
MNLILLVKSYRDQPMPGDVICRFTEVGGSIGRGPDNDLTLDDPGKYISRVHARIELRGAEFYLTDTGSNPSLVNERPLGNGRERVLEEGDRLVIGDYALEVRLEQPAAVEPEDDALATRILPPLFVPPPPPVAAPLPPLEVPQPLVRNPEVVVPVLLHDDLAGARILEGGSLFDGAMPLSDPLGLNPSLTPAFRGTESDHVPPQLQAFNAPLWQAEPQVIPEDYDPLFGLSTQPTVAPEPHVGAGLLAKNDNAVIQEQPIVLETFASKPAPTLTASNSDDAVLHALLQGLGLPDLHTTRTPTELAQLVGEMLRATTTGTMDVLMARALTKRESHIDMTMIGAYSNNPLKFFPDADSALTQMLGGDSPAYMRPVKAMNASFEDLKAHELAVIAGMRAALGAVVQRFDPARVEQRRTTHGALDKWMPARRKARLWDRLVERYEDLARDADEDLQRLFGELFSKAYEEQVARMRS